MYARLSRWCHFTAGDYAWAFDNPEDLIVPRLAANSLIGFDCTDQINHCGDSRTPMTAYLLHVVSQLLGTRRLVCFMDEFQALLADPAFAGFADKSLPTWRKLDGVMFMATQSPRKVIESPISSIRDRADARRKSIYPTTRPPARTTSRGSDSRRASSS